MNTLFKYIHNMVSHTHTHIHVHVHVQTDTEAQAQAHTNPLLRGDFFGEITCSVC